jgi:hypothetical protein
MHTELNSVCIRHLCFRGLLLRRAETAIGVLVLLRKIVLFSDVVAPKEVRTLTSHENLTPLRYKECYSL